MPVIAFTTALLVLKQVLLVVLQGGTRVRTGQFAKEEDARAFRGKAGGDAPIVELAQHVIRNGLENEPIFLILLLVVHGAMPDTDLGPYAWTFVAARYLHALFFLRRSQPMRTIAYMVGFAAMVGLAVQLALYALPQLGG